MADGRPEQAMTMTMTMAAIAEALHALCQPLTALQCRLEIGQMGGAGSVPTSGEGAGAEGSPAGYAECFAECLGECGRLRAAVDAMRDLILQAAERGRNT